jgi:hypothetical protein
LPQELAGHDQGRGVGGGGLGVHPDGEIDHRDLPAPDRGLLPGDQAVEAAGLVEVEHDVVRGGPDALRVAHEALRIEGRPGEHDVADHHGRRRSDRDLAAQLRRSRLEQR